MRPELAQLGRQHVATPLVIGAFVCVVSVVLVAQSQDRFTLKSANNIAFSEFRDYEAWQLIATSQPDDAGGCGTSKVGCTKAILGNPTMIKAYREGIPANGKPVPDGAAIAKIEWLKARNNASPYGVTVSGPQTEVSFMVKDSKRFPDTDGWGYAAFEHDVESGAFKPAKPTTASNAPTQCHGCHVAGAKARNFVYTEYAQR
jgi:hypothetical protein